MNQKFLLGLCLLAMVSCSHITTLNSDGGQKLATDNPAAATVDGEIAKDQGELKNPKRIVNVVNAAPVQNTGNQIKGSARISHDKEAQGGVYFLYGAEHLNLKNYYFDIPVVYNAAVKKWMNYFLNRGKDFFIRYSERSGRYAPVLGKILESYGLPRDLVFLAMAESGFHNKAKSWAKAVGPWQFMPYTGKRYGLHIDWYIDERRDPIKATISAAKYLKDLYALFGSWELAAAGYNAGEGKVSRAIKRYKTENFWKIRRGRYLKSETKNYVPKIMALAIIGKNLSSFGFAEIDFHETLDFDEIDVPGNSDLMQIAQAMSIPFEEIQRLNPEILRWQTPPDRETYKLRVPVGMKVAWNDCCTKKEFKAMEFQKYYMRSSSKLTSVARKFKVPAKVLAKLNNISSPRKRLKRGDLVLLPFREGQSRKANMYADLYEKPRKRVRRWRKYKRLLKRALRRGRKIASPREWYKVRKGDTLWRVARKTGVSMDTIIKSNYDLVRKRMIRAGDRLAIR